MKNYSIELTPIFVSIISQKIEGKINIFIRDHFVDVNIMVEIGKGG